ncbi:hypothetical protein D9758_001752 [Tetrapyrgos nigripes]|uniref:Mitochondrial escape protein 2 n=1 Tax=Tetrapyrgos nigripes TaxID=182062 RepID=A0A8H5LX60_9AGAR|nr:hypothetical protein D9758_001752 [Tetrapyrgos nigripes]
MYSSFRRYLGDLREETLLGSIRDSLASVKVQKFQLVTLDPHPKDGGVFVRFKYQASNEDHALKTIKEEIEKCFVESGGVSSWIGRRRTKVWVVQGNPWPEDMNRFASKMIKISFDGPDVPEEALYSLLRPYGRISDITDVGPAPAGTLRSTTVNFERLKAATIARNTIHGLSVQVPGGSTTRLRLLTVYIPEFKLYKWLKANTLERLYTPAPSVLPSEEVWQERKDAKDAIRAYLTDQPTTVAFVHGPQGSGKTTMVESVTKECNRNRLLKIMWKEDPRNRLSRTAEIQTGYRPVFSFLNSMNNLVDLASVGLIGQKAGFSSSIEEQLQQTLDIVATALKKVGALHREQIEKEMEKRDKEGGSSKESKRPQQDSTKGRSQDHDGRRGYVAGNGVMSELGVGDEKINDEAAREGKRENRGEEKEDGNKRQKNDVKASEPLPVVVIRSYASKGGLRREEIMNVIASWAARLAESQASLKRLASRLRAGAEFLMMTIFSALPSKPLNYIALYDADSSNALSFVKQKLHRNNADLGLTDEDTAYVERLGGRSSDLESLVYKVDTGASIKDAVEDIINRGVGELRKNAFGDDAEDAKNLPWTREQAWSVMKNLAKDGQVWIDLIPYYDVLFNFPFKGDESALRSMEEAELINIATHNGRPSVIRPGRPVYKYVFERLVNDPIFRATQEITYNEKLIAAATETIKSCEVELLSLKEIRTAFSRYSIWRDPANNRANYLLGQMHNAESTLQKLQATNAELKKVFRTGSGN